MTHLRPRHLTRTVLATALIGLAGVVSACRPAPDRPPNIVYILTDDLGYGEVGAYGQTRIKTPNIDRLAEEGMLFTQHYSGSPVCAPSRGTLLTGKHTGNAYVRDNYEMGGWGPDEPEGQLPLLAEEVTVGELLREAGYATSVIGKWGLGGPESEGHPNRQGFDHFYGYLCQRVAHNYYPTHLWRNESPDSLDGNTWFSAHQRIDEPLADVAEYFERYHPGPYSPDLMRDEALSFVRDHADEPFFLLFATPVPHAAIQVPREALDEYGYAGAFDDSPYLGERGYLPFPEPRAGYAAMVTRMDADVGQLLDLLDELGLRDDTIVLFSSDNGPTFNGGTDSEYFDSAAGLRGLKGSVYEGGIRVPFIVRWPGHVEAGAVSDHVSAFWDFLPTVADVVAVEPPPGIDGLSMLPALTGRNATGRAASQADHDYLYWEYHAYGGMQAVRMDRWKAVRNRIREQDDAPVELYDLTDDPGESVDVADANPQVVARVREVMAARKPSAIQRWNFVRVE